MTQATQQPQQASSPEPAPFDVFISYAREDQEWVKANLYEPLLRCRTADGRRPNVFFDVEALAVGQNFIGALSDAIKRSRKVVTVYSVTYFRKDMCQWELGMCSLLDPTGKHGKLNPILKEPEADAFVPLAVRSINYLPVTMSDWFRRLCGSLDLHPAPQQTILAFMDQPPEQVLVNHTLPPLRVSLRTESGGRSDEEETVALRAENATLQGTLRAKTVGGVATFSDLSVGEPVGATRLLAEAEGHDSVATRPLRVTVSASAPHTSSRRVLRHAGEAVFFDDGQALAVITSQSIATFAIADHSDLKPGPECRLQGRLRLWRRARNVLAVADWHGRVYVMSLGQPPRVYQLSRDTDGFAVVADLSFAGQQLYAALWNGDVYRLPNAIPSDSAAAPSGTPPDVERVAQHAGGLCALALQGDDIYTAGFDDQVRVHRNGAVVNTYALGPGLCRLKAYPGGVVAVGERKLYQIRPNSKEALAEPSHLNSISAVFDESANPVLIDRDGKGIRFDQDLITTGFHTAPGTAPVSADDAGHLCVFAHQDGSRTVLLDHKVVLTHRGGTFAVSPAANMLAIGDREGIQLVPPSTISGLAERSP